MKHFLLITIFFLSATCLFSQKQSNLPPLVDISTQLDFEKGNVFLDTSIVEVDYFLNTYTPEEYYDALYIFGQWDITTKEAMFDNSDLIWDDKLDLDKVKDRYINFVKDLTDLNSSLILNAKYFEDWDVEINETNFIITFGELVNAQEVIDVLFKYELRDLFYIFHSPINVETGTTSVNSEDYNSQLQAYYSNGILEVNSNSEVLKSIQIFDLYGNKISSVNSLNTKSYIINTNLSSGVYFVLINDKQTIKLSITE